MTPDPFIRGAALPIESGDSLVVAAACLRGPAAMARGLGAREAVARREGW